jgi:hypothetical protein
MIDRAADGTLVPQRDAVLTVAFGLHLFRLSLTRRGCEDYPTNPPFVDGKAPQTETDEDSRRHRLRRSHFPFRV